MSGSTKLYKSFGWRDVKTEHGKTLSFEETLFFYNSICYFKYLKKGQRGTNGFNFFYFSEYNNQFFIVNNLKKIYIYFKTYKISHFANSVFCEIANLSNNQNSKKVCS